MQKSKIKTAQEVGNYVRHLRQALYMSLGILSVGVLSACFALPILSAVATFGIAAVFYSLLYLVLDAEIVDMKFVDAEKMLELHESVEHFPDAKESLCQILRVRPFLTAQEYHQMKVTLRMAKKAKNVALWQDVQKTACK